MWNMRDEELLNTCRYLYTVAIANQAALADYGLTKTEIDAFKDTIDAFHNVLSAPRNAVAQRKAHQARLNELFKAGDEMLKSQIDKLSLSVKKANPEFYGAYKINRRIVNSATSTTALRVTTKHAKTGEPIYDAKVQIEALNWQDITDKQGQALLKPIPYGMYTLKVSKEGFQPHITNELKIITGKTNSIIVLLQ